MEGKLGPKITDPNELKRFVNENIHKVRNCEEYYDEYYECKRIKGRFHQYFIFGEFLDCSSWESDFQNCTKSFEDKDKNLEKLASIIYHEDERREQRLKNHLKNDVWPKRTEPPANWNDQLPEWMVEKNVQEEIRKQIQCVIS